MSWALIWAALNGGAGVAVTVMVVSSSWAMGYARRSQDSIRSTSVAPGSWVTDGVPIVYRNRTSRSRSGTAGLKVTVRTGTWASDGSGVPVVRLTCPSAARASPWP